jgi:hypothetical protein
MKRPRFLRFPWHDLFCEDKSKVSSFFLETKKEKHFKIWTEKIYALKHNTVTENAMNKPLLVGNVQKSYDFLWISFRKL